MSEQEKEQELSGKEEIFEDRFNQNVNMIEGDRNEGVHPLFRGFINAIRGPIESISNV